MKRIILTIFFMMLLAPAISAQPQNFNEMGNKGMELVFNLQYDEANEIFDEMIRLAPENALGYFLKSKNNFWIWAFGQNGNQRVKLFETFALEAIDVSKGMLARNRDDVDALFYSGNIYGYLGRWYGEEGHWMKAFWYGRKGKKYLEKIIKKDPEYYDAYFGLGVYHYYADVLPKFVKVLSYILGLGGDREKGIEEVTIALQKGNLTRGEALYFLGYEIYFNIENNHEQALPLLKELTAKYPGNPNLIISLAACYRNLTKHDLAVETLKNSLQRESTEKNGSVQIRLYRDLGNTYSDMNEYNKALESQKNALTLLESQKRTNSWEYDWTLYFIGDCYEMTGDVDNARVYYSKVSAEDKTGANALARERLNTPLTPPHISYVKGTNHMKCGEYTRAREIFNELMAAEVDKNPLNKPFIMDLYFNIGKLEYEAKEYQKSIRAFQNVLASKDIDKKWMKPWSHYYLGNCYKDIGEFEKAKQEYVIADKHDGNALRQAVDRARDGME